MMRTQIQKWGNSLAVRIPASFAKDIEVTEGIKVELSLQDGGIFLLPVKRKRKKYSLSKLIDGITENNIHQEIDTGEGQGGEIC